MLLDKITGLTSTETQISYLLLSGKDNYYLLSGLYFINNLTGGHIGIKI